MLCQNTSSRVLSTPKRIRRGKAPNGWATDIVLLDCCSEQRRLDINEKEISKLLFVAKPKRRLAVHFHGSKRRTVIGHAQFSPSILHNQIQDYSRDHGNACIGRETDRLFLSSGRAHAIEMDRDSFRSLR